MTPETPSIFVKLAEQSPYLVLMVAMVWMFLQFIERAEQRRVENAKLAEQDRAEHARKLQEAQHKHDVEINAMWARAIKEAVERQNEAARIISEALADHEKASQERYEKMGITNELLALARRQLLDRNRDRD